MTFCLDTKLIKPETDKEIKNIVVLFFFTEAVGITDHLNNFKDNQDILLQEEW